MRCRTTMPMERCDGLACLPRFDFQDCWDGERRGSSGVAAAGGLFSGSLPGDLFDVAAFAESAERIDGEIAGGSPFGGEGSNVLPEGAAEELFGGDEITFFLQYGELFAIDESGFEPELLRGNYGLDHGFDFAFEVVAL